MTQKKRVLFESWLHATHSGTLCIDTMKKFKDMHEARRQQERKDAYTVFLIISTTFIAVYGFAFLCVWIARVSGYTTIVCVVGIAILAVILGLAIWSVKKYPMK